MNPLPSALNCLFALTGITEENIDEVAWCVDTPQLEKQARAAASSIFRKLNPLKDRNLSKDEYMKAVEDLADNKVERKLLEKAGKLCIAGLIPKNYLKHRFSPV